MAGSSFRLVVAVFCAPHTKKTASANGHHLWGQSWYPNGGQGWYPLWGPTHRSERKNSVARRSAWHPFEGQSWHRFGGQGWNPGFVRQKSADPATSRPANEQPAIHRNMAGGALSCLRPPIPPPRPTLQNRPTPGTTPSDPSLTCPEKSGGQHWNPIFWKWGFGVPTLAPVLEKNVDQLLSPNFAAQAWPQTPCPPPPIAKKLVGF